MRGFVQKHFRHFNAGAVADAAEEWVRLLAGGGRMMVTLAGAMSTAEVGRSLAPLIRAGGVHAIACTGANLEEDLFHLVAAEHYVRIADWRDLSPEDEEDLLRRRLNRVTDTCIPEEEAMRRVERPLLERWKAAESNGERYFPHEYLFQMLEYHTLDSTFQKDPAESWLYAAWECGVPLFVPGWEDSTLANHFVSEVLMGNLSDFGLVRPGLEYMAELARWYRDTSAGAPVGFFQVGGGIAGDFPVCVVPLINQDMMMDFERGVRHPDWPEAPFWAYFCQVGDAPASYGGYSGAPPNEKITWGKLGPDTPRFAIQSDATVVCPLVFEYVREQLEALGAPSS